MIKNKQKDNRDEIGKESNDNSPRSFPKII